MSSITQIAEESPPCARSNARAVSQRLFVRELAVDELYGGANDEPEVTRIRARDMLSTRGRSSHRRAGVLMASAASPNPVCGERNASQSSTIAN
jgi:hypothetical protein